MKTNPCPRLAVLSRSLAISSVLVVLTMRAASAQLKVLPGHVPVGISKLKPLGALDPSRRLNLAIGLPLRNRTQLTNLLDQLYNPASPKWHHFLTVKQFTEQFGPTTNEYQAVVAFAQKNGFRITGMPPNRMLLKVNATVGQIESAFHIHLQQYRHPTENRLFYAPDVEPSVNASLPILHVDGLDNYHLPHPGGHISPNVAPKTLPVSWGGTGPSGSWMGKDFRKAYVPGTTLTGAGQKVGLFEFDGYYGSDITNYAIQSGLPTVALTNVLVDGFDGIPDNQVNPVLEVSLDIEMAASMAPGLAQIMVYESQSYNSGVDIFNQMAVDDQAQQLSCSWSITYSPTSDQVFLEFAAQGQSFFICSTDNDAFNASAGYPIAPPTDNPYATVVGGTSLQTTFGGAWNATLTRVWNKGNGTGSGGGISSTYPIPSWQQSVDMSANGGSTTWRNIPDVACVASGFYVIYNNGTTTTGGWGTSFSTPLWAGFTALANQQAAAYGLPRLGFLNPIIYRIGQSSFYHSAFHDITSGNNFNSYSPTNFVATTGYDLCTGWGSPNGTNLINLLAPAPNHIVLGTPISSGENLQFTVFGLASGLTNYLQSSTNLSSPQNWVTIATNVATSSSMVVSGLSRSNSPVRFFRVVQQP